MKLYFWDMISQFQIYNTQFLNFQVLTVLYVQQTIYLKLLEMLILSPMTRRMNTKLTCNKKWLHVTRLHVPSRILYRCTLLPFCGPKTTVIGFAGSKPSLIYWFESIKSIDQRRSIICGLINCHQYKPSIMLTHG